MMIFSNVWAVFGHWFMERNLGSYTGSDGVDLGIYISMSFSAMNLNVSIWHGEILSSEAKKKNTLVSFSSGPCSAIGGAL